MCMRAELKRARGGRTGPWEGLQASVKIAVPRAGCGDARSRGVWGKAWWDPRTD